MQNDLEMLIPRSSLKRRWSISEMTIWRMERAGKMPKPALIMNKRKFYKLADIEAFERSTVSHV